MRTKSFNPALMKKHKSQEKPSLHAKDLVHEHVKFVPQKSRLFLAFGAENDSFVGFASRAIKDLVRELQYGFQGPVPRKSG